MQPLHEWPLAARRNIHGVLTDIDDTLTTAGAITPEALEALATLRAAGLRVIAVTGRPVGWSVPFAQSWPLDAIVAENGAVALIERGTQKIYQQDAATRAANCARLQAVARQVLRDIPGTTLAQDSPGRETDIAIDHGEFAHLPPERIEAVARLMQREGLRATVSSIHINGWLGAHDKLSGARWIVRQLFGRALDDDIGNWVYVGDSTNDELMFEHFPHSVGVANIRRFAAQLAHPPRYIAEGERGAGFAEVAAALLSARSGTSA